MVFDAIRAVQGRSNAARGKKPRAAELMTLLEPKKKRPIGFAPWDRDGYKGPLVVYREIRGGRAVTHRL